MADPHIKFTTLKEPRIGTQSPKPWSGREPHLGGEASVAVLLVALKKWHSRPQAAQALIQAGQRAVPGLLNALYDTNAGVRVYACRILAAIGDSRSVYGLVGALWDEHELVRREAATALGQLAHPEAIDGLLNALSDEDIWVRREAAHALGQIGQAHGDAIHPVFPTLLSLVSESAEVRYAAMLAFVDCGPAAVTFLIETITHGPPLQRTLAAEALVRIARHELPLVDTELCQAHALSDHQTQRNLTRVINRIRRQSASA